MPSGPQAPTRLTTPPLTVGEYRVRVLATTTDGGILDLGDIALSILGSTRAEDQPPPAFALAPPAPNPSASGTVRAVLTVRKPARVLAVVYDALGREVAVVHDTTAVGRVEVVIDTTRFAPGAYVLRAAVLDGSDAAARRFTPSPVEVQDRRDREPSVLDAPRQRGGFRVQGPLPFENLLPSSFRGFKSLIRFASADPVAPQ